MTRKANKHQDTHRLFCCFSVNLPAHLCEIAGAKNGVLESVQYRTVSQKKRTDFTNGIARNYKDLFWRHLAEKFEIP